MFIYLTDIINFVLFINFIACVIIIKRYIYKILVYSVTIMSCSVEIIIMNFSEENANKALLSANAAASVTWL